MQSKTSFFSPTIFKKNISRFYLLAILYLVAQCVALPLLLQMNMDFNFSHRSYASQMVNMVRTIYGSTQITAFIAFCGAAVSAMAVFSYLYNARSANMMAALPVRRESMFISSCAAIYAVVIVSDLIAVLLAFILTMSAGLPLGRWLVEWFFISLGQFTLFFGLAVFCAQLTGSLLAMPLIYLVANFASVVLSFVIVELGNVVIYGVNLHVPDFFLQLSPFFRMMDRGAWIYTGDVDMSDPTIEDVGRIVYRMTPELIAYTIAGLVLLLIAFLLHRRRAMETAGDVVAVRILRPVFRILFTLGCGLVGGFIFYILFLNNANTGTGDAVRIMISVGLFALVGYVLAEMILRKSTRVPLLRTGVPALVISALLVCGIWSMEADLFGIESAVPDAADIQEVTLASNGRIATFTDRENIGWITALHHTILDNKDRNDDNRNNFDFQCAVTYTLTNGKIVERRYTVCYNGDYPVASPTPEAVIMNTVMNSPEGILSRKKLDVEMTARNITAMSVQNFDLNFPDEVNYVNFTPEEAEELYRTCIYPDMLDGTIGLTEIGNSGNFHEFYPNEIEFWLMDANEQKNQSEYDDLMIEDHAYNEKAMESVRFYTYPTTESVRTNAWLQSHGITLDKGSTFVN